MSQSSTSAAPLDQTLATRRHGESGDLLESKLAAIPDLQRAELMTIWAAAYGHPPPKGLSRRLLEYAAAYHLQARALGRLKPAARRKLKQLAGASGSGAVSQAPASKPKTLSPGSRLIREWHGKTYTVEILEGAYQCDGQRYQSLSEVARAITGARWSGPRFFGL